MGAKKRVRLSGAERQRLYRAKRDADSERRAKYLAEKHEKYVKDKELGKRKLVASMTPREHRQAKRQWNASYRNVKNKRQQAAMALTISTVEQVSDSPLSSVPSRQKLASLQKKANENAALRDKVAELEARLKSNNSCIERLRKRAHRSGNNKKVAPLTPKSKTKAMLRKENISLNSKESSVKKTLEFHFALMSEIGAQKNTGTNISLSKLSAGSILRKYKFTRRFQKELKVKGMRRRKYPKRGSIGTKVKKSVINFFLREDVSKICPGKKDTITRYKVKKQRRFLVDTLSNLHKKYIAENTYASFTTFWRCKPFWVLPPKSSDRSTCLCKACENVRFLAKGLKKLNVIPTDNIEVLLHQICCNVNDKLCMYNECVNCKKKEISKCSTTNENIKFEQWETVKEERRFKTGDMKVVSFVMKQLKCEKLDIAWQLFHDQLRSHKKHFFNMVSQFRHYRKVRETLTKEEAIIHIDFSENYECKWDTEIQSAHFGASKKQLVLHTGYFQTGGRKEIRSFCGVSDSLRRDPFAIWTYLSPILNVIKQECPDVKRLHFFSDGPTAQYRQKVNFFLFSSVVLEKGFTSCSWNFFEAGHGKGIPDGIGASVKRAADRAIRYGNNICSAPEFVKVVSKHCQAVHIYSVDEKEIISFEKSNSVAGLKPVPRTMKLHQIFCIKPHVIEYRDISCTCVEGNECDSTHTLDQFLFPDACSEGRSLCSSFSEDEIFYNEKESREEVVDIGIEIANDESAEIAKFKVYLNTLEKCTTFGELRHECESQMLGMSEIYGAGRSLLECKINIYTQASGDVPNDIPYCSGARPRVFPVNVRCDGDCLPGCGAVFAFGKDVCPEAIRVRIIHELCTHAAFYLDDTLLSRGLPCTAEFQSRSSSCKQAFASFSDHFVYGTHSLTNDLVVRELYEKEVMGLCKAKSYMGIWQLFGLASVLKMRIISVFPQGTCEVTRQHVHRVIEPRVRNTEDVAMILWTSTLSSQKSWSWRPNHFVPLLPLHLNY